MDKKLYEILELSVFDIEHTTYYYAGIRHVIPNNYLDCNVFNMINDLKNYYINSNITFNNIKYDEFKEIVLKFYLLNLK